MKYCINFYQSFRHLEEIDEMIIPYRNNIITIDFIKFLESIKEHQRIIIDISHFDIEDNIEKLLEFITTIKKQHNNLSTRLSLTQKKIIDKLIEKEVSFFFNEYIDRWDTLISFIELGISDVYIVNELGFELEKVSMVCKEKNISIRIIPNVAQTSAKINNINTLKSFFIRPEDIPIYEKYIDICEFFGPLDRQSVLYEIYKNQKWMGDLKELIVGLNYSILNKTIFPVFGEKRVNCNKKCYYNQCTICDRVVSISNQLNEAGIEIIIKKDKGVNNEDKLKTNEKLNDNETRATTSNVV